MTRKTFNYTVRAIPAIIAALTVSLAFAQETPERVTEAFAYGLANDANLVVIDCPEDLVTILPDAVCMGGGYATDDELARMKIELALLGDPRVETIEPWKRINEVVTSRAYLYEPSDAIDHVFLVGIYENGVSEYEVIIFVGYVVGYDGLTGDEVQ